MGNNSKKSPTTERVQRLKSSVSKVLERDLSFDKHLGKEKMKKIVENSQRESEAVKNLKNGLYKSASMKNKNDEFFDELCTLTLNRNSYENKMYNSSANWNRNNRNLDYSANFYGEEKTKSFGQTFSNLKLKSSYEMFAK